MQIPQSLFPMPRPGFYFYLCFLLFLVFSSACALKPHQSSIPTPMTIEALFVHCGLPQPCDEPAAWEGQKVTITGSVDPANIFDKEHYPQLSYEKFRLTDGRGRSVEVWAQASDNQPIFKKLAARDRDHITVTGRLAAVRLPMSGRCIWNVKVLINDPSQIEF